MTLIQRIKIKRSQRSAAPTLVLRAKKQAGQLKLPGLLCLKRLNVYSE
jgi:hypothetical protein